MQRGVKCYRAGRQVLVFKVGPWERGASNITMGTPSLKPPKVTWPLGFSCYPGPLGHGHCKEALALLVKILVAKTFAAIKDMLGTILRALSQRTHLTLTTTLRSMFCYYPLL